MSRIRWGISWQVDDAEPEVGLREARVMAGTPAEEEQGLKVGDRIYAINDQKLTTQEKYSRICLVNPRLNFWLSAVDFFRTIKVKRLGTEEAAK